MREAREVREARIHKRCRQIKMAGNGALIREEFRSLSRMYIN